MLDNRILTIHVNENDRLDMGCGYLSHIHSLTRAFAQGGGKGAVLRYFHTYVGSGHFFGFKVLNF